MENNPTRSFFLLICGLFSLRTCKNRSFSRISFWWFHLNLFLNEWTSLNTEWTLLSKQWNLRRMSENEIIDTYFMSRFDIYDIFVKVTQKWVKLHVRVRSNWQEFDCSDGGAFAVKSGASSNDTLFLSVCLWYSNVIQWKCYDRVFRIK